MNSTSSTSSSASLKTSSLMRLTGTDLYSGLDTDSLIKKLVAKTQSKIDKAGQKEQIAEWRREAYRTVISDLKKFSTTYFSYSNSSTNILSTTFFKNKDILSSSDAVSATGSTDKASLLIIDKINSLAKQASYISSEEVSSKTITSGTIESSWTKSSVGGNSLVLHYGKTDYTLTVSNSVQLDSCNTDANGKVKKEEFQKIVDNLNSQISEDDDLKGNVSFGLTDDLKITLSTAKKDVTLKAYQEDDDDTRGKDFLTALGFNVSTKTVGTATSASTLTASSALDTDPTTSNLFNKTISSGSEIKLNYNGENYTINLGINVGIYNASQSNIATAITNALNSQIQKNTSLSDLKDKVSVSVNASGSISFGSSSGTVAVNGGSRNLLEGLGLATYNDTTGLATSYSNSGSGMDQIKLCTSYFSDSMAGSTLTFTLDGIEKTISFDDSDASLYAAPEQLAGSSGYLQKKLDTAFGSGKVTVAYTDGKLSFTTADTTSVLSITSSDNINVCGKSGALRIASGETNRTELTKTLKELSKNKDFAMDLTPNADGNYVLNLNGVTMTFSQDTELSSVISQINSNKDVGLKVSYSTTSDKFSILSSDSGTQATINVQDIGGNLGEILMGQSDGTTSYIDLANNRAAIQSTAITDPVVLAQNTIYAFTLNGETKPHKITLAAGTYNSADAVKTALETAISGDSDLAGKVTVTLNSSTNQLEINSSDGTSALEVAFVTGTDALGTGNSGKTNLSDTSSLSSYYTAGKNLSMRVSLDGGVTFKDITRTSNNTTLDGINLQIKNTSDSQITFSTSIKTDDLKTKISDFVDAYNKIIDEVNTLVTTVSEKTSDHKTKYTPLTDDQKSDMTESEIDKWETEAKKGVLLNDNDLSSLLSDLRASMTSMVSSAGSSLSKIGISVDSYDYTSGGKLVIDDNALETALASDPDRVAELFTNSDGIAARVKKVLDKNVGTFGGNGVLLMRAGTNTTINDTSELTTQIKDYQKTISKLKVKLKTEEERWWTKFSAMETALSKLNSQAGYLNSMSGYTSS